MDLYKMVLKRYYHSYFTKTFNMMYLKVLLLLSVFFLNTKEIFGATDKIVCYYGTWSTYRHGNGKFSTRDIDPNLCTHLIYGFVGIIPDGSVRLLDAYLDVEAGNFKAFNDHKKVNKNLKTLLAIGGWNEGSENYSKVAADPAKRAAFINSALALILTHGFDGFDLDWEYPGQRGGSADDKKNYSLLLKEFRAAFDQHGLLLTAAVGASRASAEISYDIPSLSKYLDLINVMTYDFHGAWDSGTGQNAPLYPSSIEEGAARELNVNSSISEWIRKGADPQKIALGLGVYGRSFTLADPNKNGLGAPVRGAGAAGPYTSEVGMLGYNEIVELIHQGGWKSVFDEEQQTPYISKGNQWIGYDNPESIAIKVNFAKSLNLGAVMIWSIETDDFRGVSGVKFPILRTINAVLAGESIPILPAPSQRPTFAPSQAPSASTARPSTSSPSGTLCEREGYVKDPKDCTLFYYCFPNGSHFIAYPFQCSSGLVFDLENLMCNYPYNVQC